MKALFISYEDLLQAPSLKEQKIETLEKLIYLTSEAAPLVKKYLKSRGLWWDLKGVYFTKKGLKAARKLTSAIVEEYESEKENGLWEKFDLSGDDDVDYNGSYIEAIIDAIEEVA